MASSEINVLGLIHSKCKSQEMTIHSTEEHIQVFGGGVFLNQKFYKLMWKNTKFLEGRNL